MDADWLTVVAAVIASILGTTGLAGALSGGLEVSRRSRLRRHIGRALDLRDRVKPRTPEWEALTYSARLDSVRLASLSIVGIKQRLQRSIRPLVLSVLFFASITAVLLLSDALPDGFMFEGALLSFARILPLYVATLAGTSVFFVAVVDMTLRGDRRDFVEAVMEGKTVESAVAAIDQQ